MHDLSGRGPYAFEFLTEAKLATEVSAGGLKKSGQALSTHIAASSAERSVPGKTRRASSPRRVHRLAPLVE
jgi:hypothetical protein